MGLKSPMVPVKWELIKVLTYNQLTWKKALWGHIWPKGEGRGCLCSGSGELRVC